MINLRFVPLDLKDFPSARKPHQRRRSQFKAPWNKTLELLEHELEQLGAAGIVLQAGFSADKIRQDGWPYGKVSPTHPAVILSFRDVENRPLSFPCDRFETHTENIRAIALSLEALRAVDRFGVTKLGEQYAGFKQIEAPKQMTVEDAAQFLDVKSGVRADVIVQSAENYRLAYRGAAKILHPDQKGNPYEWELLAKAKALLDAHHGLNSKAEALLR